MNFVLQSDIPSMIHKARRVVLKLGTSIVIEKGGELAKERLAELVSDCSRLVKEGRELLVVSSGAVGLGRNLAQLGGDLDLSEKQACAAMGQPLLMSAYQGLFERHGLKTAQLLLTASDFSNRQRYLNLQSTLEKLCDLGMVTIINENDPVSTMEIKEENQTKSFGDNDKLSALVAGKLNAGLLIILTDVDGIYTRNPKTDSLAKRLSVIQEFGQLSAIGSKEQSVSIAPAYGRGGIHSKVEAARIAAISGVMTVIASGFKKNIVRDLFEQRQKSSAELEKIGTFVLPQMMLEGRKRWIGFSSGYVGVVTVNAGAKEALMKHHASLLPVGVIQVEGDFQAQQVVSIQDEQGVELGRGIVEFSAQNLRKIKGSQSQHIPEIIGAGFGEEVIHRDHLVIFEEC